MTNQYTLYYSDSLKQPIIINQEEINNDTSLTLFGKDTPGWGSYWNTNIINLLGNFYGEYPPGYGDDGNSTNFVVEGQLWFDSHNDQLKICVSNNPLKWDIICNNDSPELYNILTSDFLNSKLMDFIPLSGHNKQMEGPLLLTQVNHDESDLTRLATKRYVDRKLCDCDDLLSANIADYALLAGDTITGSIYLPLNYANPDYCATKDYVDNQIHKKDKWYNNIEILDDLGNSWLSDSIAYTIASDVGENLFSILHISGNFTFLGGLYSCYISPAVVLTKETYIMIHGGIKDNGDVSDVIFNVDNGVIHITRNNADIDELVYFNIDIFEGGEFETLLPEYASFTAPVVTISPTPTPTIDGTKPPSSDLWVYLGAFINKKYYIVNAHDGEKKLAWASTSADTKADDLIDGSMNCTQLLGNVLPIDIKLQKTNPAAYFCGSLSVDNKNDWYLPARDELYYAYFIQKTALETLGVEALDEINYWASSEFDKDKAYIQSVKTGKWSNQTAKKTSTMVRAIRSEPTNVTLKIASDTPKAKIDSKLKATITGTTAASYKWYSGTTLTKVTGDTYTVLAGDNDNMISATVMYTDSTNVSTHITSNFIYIDKIFGKLVNINGQNFVVSDRISCLYEDISAKITSYNDGSHGGFTDWVAASKDQLTAMLKNGDITGEYWVTGGQSKKESETDSDGVTSETRWQETVLKSGSNVVSGFGKTYYDFWGGDIGFEQWTKTGGVEKYIMPIRPA